MTKFIHMFFSPCKGKVLSQIFSLIVLGLFSYALLITISFCKSYTGFISQLKNEAFSSVIWDADDAFYFQLDKGINEEDKELILSEEKSRLENLESVKDVVIFEFANLYDVDENKDEIICDYLASRVNDYFLNICDFKDKCVDIEKENTVILNKKYKSLFKLNDEITLHVGNIEHQDVKVTLRVVGFEELVVADYSAYSLDAVISEKIIDSSGVLLETPDIGKTICIIPADNKSADEVLPEIISSLVNTGAVTSKILLDKYRKSTITTIPFVVLIAVLSFTGFYTVVFSKNLSFLMYRRRHMMIHYICGSTFEENIKYTLIFELTLILLGYLLGLTWYVNSYKDIMFTYPVELSLDYVNVGGALLCFILSLVLSSFLSLIILKNQDATKLLSKE